MSEYTVTFASNGSIFVAVEASDYNEAIDKAYNDLPRGLCVHCSGWDQSWGRDEGDPEAIEVVDGSTGKTVWTERDGEVSS